MPKTREQIVKDIIKETSREIPQITNYHTGGVFRLFVEVVAVFLAKIYEVLESLRPQRFTQTATGEYLDWKAEELGLVRRPAVKAQGYVLMSRTQAGNAVKIPAGKVVSSQLDSRGKSSRYAVLEEQILAEGETEIPVLVEAEEEGSAHNLGAGRISEFSTPISGVGAVSNPSDWLVQAGADIESDESLRLRCLALWRGLSGANASAYASWAKNVEGVGEVKVVPLARGAGTVNVIFTALRNASPNEALIEKVYLAIEERRPVAADVLARAPVEVAITVGVEVVFLPNSEARKLVVEEAVHRYFSSLGIGDDFEPSALVAKVMGVEGVKSATVIPDTVRISDLQIARLGTLSLTVSNAVES